MAFWNRANNAIAANNAAEQMLRDSLASGPGPYALSVDSASLARSIIGPSVNRTNNALEDSWSRHRMIAMRLRIPEGERMPFDDIHTSLGKEKIFVFILQNDKPVVLEDDIGLFPSDALVTQLRLIAK